MPNTVDRTRVAICGLHGSFIQEQVCVYQGCSPEKKKWGTPETRLRQRFF